MFRKTLFLILLPVLSFSQGIVGTVFMTKQDRTNISTLQSEVSILTEQVNYVLPTVAYVSSSAGYYEIGSTNTSINLGFTCNKTMTSRNYSGGYVGILGSGGSYAFVLTTNIYSSKTFTITVVDSKTNSATASQALTFTNRKYYGVLATETNLLTNSELIGLTKTWQAKGNSGTVAPNNQYIYVCYPVSLGLCSSFTLGGFTTSPWPYITKTITNSSNYAESFYVYRSANKLTSGAIAYDIH